MNNDSSRQIKLGAVLSYLSIGLNIVMGLVYTPWMIRLIGDSDYGIYGMGTSVISLIAMDFGLGSAVTRYIAKYQAERREDKVKEVIGTALKIYLVFDLLIALVLIVIFLLMNRIFVALTTEEIKKLRVVFSIIGLYTVVSFPFQVLNGVITARERFVFQKSMDFLNKLLTVLLTGLLLLSGKGLYALVIVNAVVGCVTMGMKIVYLKKHGFAEIIWKVEDTSIARELFKFSAWVIIILVCQRLTLNILPSILGVTSGTSEIALLTPALNVEGYVYTLTGALGGLFLTRVTNMYYGEREGEKLEEMTVRIGKLQLFIIGMIFAVFLSVGKEFMFLWLGDKFQKTYYVTLLLIAPMLVTTTQEIANIALEVQGKLKYRAVSLAVTALITSGLAVPMSARMGVIGVALAAFIGYVIGGIIIVNFIYAVVLRMDIWQFFRQCHLKMLFPIALTVASGYGLNYIWKEPGLKSFVLKCLALVIEYVLLTITMVIKKEERAGIKIMLSGMRKRHRKESGKK